MILSDRWTDRRRGIRETLFFFFLEKRAPARDPDGGTHRGAYPTAVLFFSPENDGMIRSECRTLQGITLSSLVRWNIWQTARNAMGHRRWLVDLRGPDGNGFCYFTSYCMHFSFMQFDYKNRVNAESALYYVLCLPRKKKSEQTSINHRSLFNLYFFREWIVTATDGNTTIYPRSYHDDPLFPPTN